MAFSFFAYRLPITAEGPRKLLQQPPFPPTDINFFTQQLYPNSKPMVPATSSKYNSDRSLRGLIASTLAKRADQDHQIVKRGLADFDDPQLKQLIPDSRLRAGLATLEGTIGSDAIDVHQERHFIIIRISGGFWTRVCLLSGATVR